jgi:hypothetical protein
MFKKYRGILKEEGWKGLIKKSGWKVALGLFLFFLIKGLLWLIIPYLIYESTQ